MALLATPVPYDPTGILQKQRVLWITAGVMKEITAKIIADAATALAAHVAADALLTGQAAIDEAKKCVVVCANCHAEIHDKEDSKKFS